MTKLLAILALGILACANQFALYWFVFGLWPKSWTLYFVFGIANTVCLRYAFELFEKENKL